MCVYIHIHTYTMYDLCIYTCIYILYIYVIDRKINRLCWENSQLLAVDLGNSQYFQIGIFGPCSEHFHYSSSTIKPCSHPLWNWGIWGIRQAWGAFTSLCNPLYNLCHKISPDAFHVPIRNGGRLWNVLRAWIGANSVKFAMMTRWTHFTHAFNPAVLLLTQKRSMKIIRPYFCMCTDIRGNWMLRIAISCGFCTSMSCHISCLCFANFCQFPGSCLLIFHQARFELSWTYNKV